MKAMLAKDAVLSYCLLLFVACCSVANSQDGEGQAAVEGPSNVTITLISTVQGPGAVSPRLGETVTVEAIVVGDFQGQETVAAGGGQRNLFGYFLQEEDGDADDDARTSEGIFVGDGEGGDANRTVSIGDLVQVTGVVGEHFGETRLMDVSAVRVVNSSNPLPTPATISLPSPALSVDGNGNYVPDLEPYEGMRVVFPGPLAISSQRNLERFNEITLIQGEMPMHFTQRNPPNPVEYEESLVSIGNRQIIYDDGLNGQNVGITNLDGFGPTYDTFTAKRAGDTIRGLTGVLCYQWAGDATSGATWRVRSIRDGENSFSPSTQERPLSSPSTAVVVGRYRLVSANLMNYFVTLDAGDTLTANGMQPRGANTVQELGRQTTKMVNALMSLDADILGLTEVENDFSKDSIGNALDFLVSILNGAMGENVYDWVYPGQQFVDSSDAISSAFVYKTTSFIIQENTTVAILNDTILASLGLPFENAVFDGPGTNRASLAVTFAAVDGSGCVTAAINHFKSKGSASSVPGNEDQGDGAGSNNAIRLQAAKSVVAWLESDPTGSACTSKVIMGDLNSYAREDPITYIVESGYSNLEDDFMGGEAYSYRFNGAVGTLDYILVNDAFIDVVEDVNTPHYNSDEADAIDYNTEFDRDLAIFKQDVPYRYADHDPVIVGFSFFQEGTDNVTDSPTVSPTQAASTVGPTMDDSDASANMTTGLYLISQIQGDAEESPLVGKTVTVEAVVIGDFQNDDQDIRRNLDGFFLQEEDTDADDDPKTSEGIFVFEDNKPSSDVDVGQLVRVTGVVQEFFGETRLVNVSSIIIVQSKIALPTPAVISLPTTIVALDRNGALVPDLEAFEGMLVKFADTLTINSQDSLDRFNAIGLVQGDRPFHFTQANHPNVDDYETYRKSIGARQIVYDDGKNEQNIDIADLDGFGPIYKTESAKGVGDTVDALSGVLTYQWAGSTSSDSTWRVRSVEDGENTFKPSTERPPVKVPAFVNRSFKIASVNAFNFFTTIDDGESTTAIGKEPRGANNQEEFQRQTTKLVTALVSIDADLFGLLAIENDFSETEPNGNALMYLTSQLNKALGEDIYDWVRPGVQFVDNSAASASGFVFKTASFSIEPGSQPAILDDAAFPDLSLDFDSPVFDGDHTNQAALAATFLGNDGTCVTLALNHWKSREGLSAGAGNEDQGDGAGKNNAIRLQAAKSVDAWLQSNPTGSGCSSKGIIGSLNSYAKETPVTYLTSKGYFNVDEIFTGKDVYNTVRDGLVGTLDYALVNEALFFSVVDAATPHYCSNEAGALDYNTDWGRDPSIFDGSVPYRFSHSDPIVLFVRNRRGQETLVEADVTTKTPPGDADASCAFVPSIFPASVALALLLLI